MFTGLATQIVYGGCDHDTADFYSKASGAMTPDADPEPGKANFRQRPLLTVDEVVTPQIGNCIIFARYVEPAFATQGKRIKFCDGYRCNKMVLPFSGSKTTSLSEPISNYRITTGIFDAFALVCYPSNLDSSADTPIRARGLAGTFRRLEAGGKPLLLERGVSVTLQPILPQPEPPKPNKRIRLTRLLKPPNSGWPRQSPAKSKRQILHSRP